MFLQQILSQETGRRVLSAMTRLVNSILAGKIHDYARIAVFGASLVVLRKNYGGVCPIAIDIVVTGKFTQGQFEDASLQYMLRGNILHSTMELHRLLASNRRIPDVTSNRRISDVTSNGRQKCV